jgi:hypothetical protein
MAMDFDLTAGPALLARTPATLDCLLRGLGPEWTAGNEGPETWSPFDVLGHLVHGEKTDWIPRARMILEAGESQTFAPFDRFAMFRDPPGTTLAGRLEEFARLRADNLATLAAMKLTPADLARTGRHPDFGAVTLGQLLATWVVHDLGHIAQVTRVMARQHGAAVGPWRAYLPVLTR